LLETSNLSEISAAFEEIPVLMDMDDGVLNFFWRGVQMAQLHASGTVSFHLVQLQVITDKTEWLGTGGGFHA